MNIQEDPFHEIEVQLTKLRQKANAQRRFPRELWEAIIRLTQTHSIQVISLRFNISPAYLRQKIKQFHETSTLDFREISSPPLNTYSDMVLVDLVSDSGLRARIQGPSSCLNYLSALLKR